MPATIDSNQKVLATADVTFDDPANPGTVTYAWSEDSGGATVTLAEPEGASSDVVGNQALSATATATVTVTVINADGSTVTGSDTVTVNVAAAPPPPGPSNATGVAISFGTPEAQ